MKALTLSIALIGSVTMTAAAFAQGVQTNGSVTGPAGNTSTYQGTRGAGSSSQSVTGPNGQTSTRAVTRTPTGTGGVNTTATTTGPRGKGTTRTGSMSVNR